MKFAYTYRSSDGQRHSAEIEAESRDAAFTRIRTEMGVKPIKVIAAEVSGDTTTSRASTIRKTPVLVASLAVIGSLIGGAWWYGGSGATAQQPRRHSADTAAAFKALEDEAAAVRKQCGDAIGALDLDLAKNYALIERTANISFLYDEINKGRSIVEWARSRTKSVFKDIYSTFPASRANERLDAQSLYGSLMGFIDEYDERMMRLESAVMLLDSNRGKWKCVKGRIVFSDKALEDEYNFFGVEPDADAARWQMDFGDSGQQSIESTRAKEMSGR